MPFLCRSDVNTADESTTCAELPGVAVQAGRSYVVTVAQNTDLISQFTRGDKTFGLTVEAAVASKTKSGAV